MSDITSTLGFDASGAIASLRKLDSALASTDKNLGSLALGFKAFNSNAAQVPATLASLAKSAQALGASLGSVPGAASAAATNLKQLTTPQTGAQLAATGQQVERLTTSLGLLSRVVFTQLVVKALRETEQALTSAAQSASAFQLQVAEIQTISNGALGSLDKIGSSVRGVSDAFNIPLATAGKGLFNTVSNQIGKNGAEQVEFLKEAAAFSKASVSDFDSGVNLLSGTLNTFGKDVSDTADIASKFFRIIDLGNISGTQLSTSFGRVAPLAKQLGVSLEELGAGFSVLTRRGVNPSESATQLRGILTAFAKPTDELKAAMKAVGATSAESLFSANGFGGALKAVITQTDGSTAALAKLFPNVRGLSGALSLGSQAAKDFASDLEQIKATSSTLSKQKAADTLGIDGQRAEAELNKLKNSLTVDFGQSVLKAVVGLSDLTGGADNVVKVVSSIGPAFIGAAGAVGIFAAQSRIAALNGTALGGVLGKLGTVGLAVGAAFSAGDFIGDKISENLGANLKKQESDNASALTTFKSAESDKLKAAEESDTARVQSALRANEQITKGFIDASDSAAVSSKRMAEGFERGLQRITSGREKFADEIGKAEQQARDSAKDSQGRVLDLTAKHDDRTFQNNLRNVPDLQQISRLTDRAQQLSKQAQQGLTAGALSGDADTIQRALKDFGRGEQAGEQAQAIAQRIGNRTEEANAISTINSLTQKQLAAERQLQEISATRAKALDAEKEKQKAIAEQIREHAKTATENSGLFDKQGNLISADEQAKRTAKRQQALKDIVGLGLSKADLSVSDALGLTKLTTELGNEINREPIALKFIAEEDSVAKLQKQLQDAFKTFRGASPIDVSKLEKLTGRSLDTPDQVSAAQTGLKDEAATIRKNLSAQSVDQKRVSQLRGEIGTINSDFDSTARNALRGASGIGVKPEVMQAALTAIQQFRSELTRLASDANISADDIAALQARLGALKEFAGSTSSLTNAGLKVDTEALDTGLAKVREIRALQQQPAADTGRLSEIESFLQQSAQAAAPFERMAGALSGSVGTSASVAGNLERAAAAAERAARAQSAGGGAGGGGEGEGLWRGGKPRYFADGGPVGTDRIPAYLSAGESVNTRAATSKFFSQISAMNAGHSPTAASVVGDTTINVGGVTVSGGQTNAQTGDAIVTAIRRSYRRGSSRTL